jgi:hypothetical protein
MNRIRLVMMLPALALQIAACGDSCGDVACLPAPTPLEVIVYDTVSVPTTITRLEGTDTITVDTTVVRIAATTDAVVTLVTGADTLYTAVDTLVRSDTLYAESDLSRIPSGYFRIRSARGARQYISELRKVEHVAGCCPFSIVGRFRYSLPAQ